MNSNNENLNDQKSALEDYVTVAIAEDVDLANNYRDILIKHNIPAITATQRSYSLAVIGIAVMVPEHLLDQAQKIVESEQDFDNFLDDAFNDSEWDNLYDNNNYFNDGSEL
jgi:hypothetical protein